MSRDEAAQEVGLEARELEAVGLRIAVVEGGVLLGGDPTLASSGVGCHVADGVRRCGVAGAARLCRRHAGADRRKLMPPTSTMPIELRATAPAPVTSVSGKCPTTVATVVIRDRAQRARRVAAAPRTACLELGRHARLLLRVGELDDEDAVLRDQSDEGHQAHLRVDVERRRPALGGLEVHARRARELEEGEDERAEHRQRHRAREHDERVAERVELRREHQEDEDEREAHRRQELAGLLAELARLARVVHAVARRQDLLGLVLEHLEALGERSRREARDLHRVELLEAVERAGLDTRP